MERPDFPSNSISSERSNEGPKVQRVVVGEVRTRPKPLGTRLKEALIGGDSKSVIQHVIVEVLIPQAKDMLAEAATQGFNRLIYGDDRPSGRRISSRSSSGYTPYNRYSARGNNPIGRSREDRTPIVLRSGPLDELIFETRDEAVAVLEQLNDILEEYKFVTVAALFASIGKSSPNHTDNKWGWEDLESASVRLVRNGYLLILPKPVALDI